MAPRMPADVSARDRVLGGRPEVLSDAELLSVLIGAEGDAPGRSIAAELPLRDALWRASAEDLTRHQGVGPAAAARILACLEVARRSSLVAHGARPAVSTPADVSSICAPQMRGLDREHFWTLALDTKNRLIRACEVSVGSLNASIVHPREVFKEAVRLSAAGVVLVHNHPSGDPTPSGADIQLTRRLAKAGDVLGIDVLDHVVIGDGGSHTSLRDMGVI